MMFCPYFVFNPVGDSILKILEYNVLVDISDSGTRVRHKPNIRHVCQLTGLLHCRHLAQELGNQENYRVFSPTGLQV